MEQSPAKATDSMESQRLHAMDCLRAVAMLLGIGLHAALAYMMLDIPWAVRDSSRHLFFDAFVGLVHGFRMQLFFFVAGYFGRLLYVRFGPAAFLWHRGRRILIPFVAGMILLIPLQKRIWNYCVLNSGGPVHEYFGLPLIIENLAPAHLWFLYYLIIFYLVAALVVEGIRRLEWGRLLEAGNGFLQTILRARSKVLLLAAPTLAALSFSPQWQDVEVPGVSMLPQPRALFYYGCFFGFGWLIHRLPNGLGVIRERSQGAFLLAAAAFAAFAGFFSQAMNESHPFYSFFKFGCQYAHEIYAWSMVLGVTAFFLRRFDRPSRVIRYLADSSYWLYLVHLPLVLIGQFLIAPWPMHALIKFLLLNGTVLAILLASYHGLVRFTFVGVILNGRRYRLEPRPGIPAEEEKEISGQASIQEIDPRSTNPPR